MKTNQSGILLRSISFRATRAWWLSKPSLICPFPAISPPLIRAWGGNLIIPASPLHTNLTFWGEIPQKVDHGRKQNTSFLKSTATLNPSVVVAN